MKLSSRAAVLLVTLLVLSLIAGCQRNTYPMGKVEAAPDAPKYDTEADRAPAIDK